MKTEAVEKQKSEGKIVDFGLSISPILKPIDSAKKTELVISSANFG
jgi:hypothetical protein